MRYFLLLLFFGLPVAVSAETESAPLLWTRIEGTINPGTGSHIIETIERAEKENAAAVVLELNTPGGLLTTTRKIAEKMLTTPIPIVIWVGPAGARAGSAGALITLAADVAVMAAGTNIGAAHPVSSGGQKIPDTMDEKITNDTAAFAESLANRTKRNAPWAAQAVRKSVSVSAEEALRLGVIDFIADNRTELVQKLRGYKFHVAKQSRTALPDVLTITNSQMSLRNRTFSFFSDPEIAYLILSLGGLCIWIELTNPGLLLPGIVGVFCVLVSLISFEAMPIDFGALALLLAGFAMMIAEVFVAAHGLLGIGGSVAFIVGSMFLMKTSAPELQISLAVILPTAAVLLASALGLAYSILRARRLPARSGTETLIGRRGAVRETVGKTPGQIFVSGELWQAISKDGLPIGVGEKVVVESIEGLQLTVRKS